MTTREAFQQLISQRAWYKPFGITDVAAWTYANRFRSGKLTTDKMEEVLLKCGYKVVSEKVWEITT